MKEITNLVLHLEKLQHITSESNETEERLCYLDWLRIFAVLLLFLFHAARIFDVGEANYIENPVSSVTITIFFVWIINIFHMPLFFAISGASTNLSIEKRGYYHYSIDRVIKLLIPLVFGLLVVVPPQTFYAAKFHNGYEGNYLNWLFFDYFLSGFGDITGYRGSLTPAHLWFLFALLLVSFIALPITILLKRKEGKILCFFYRIADKHPFFVIFFIPAIILIAVSALPVDIEGKNVVYYLICFLLGYILVGYKNFSLTFKKIQRYLLCIMAFGYITFVIYFFWAYYTTNWNPMLDLIVWFVEKGFLMWSTLLVLFNIFMEKANKTSVIHRYASEAAYPVYIQHQTWLLVLAYFVVKWDLPLGWKYVLIMVGGLGLSIIGFEIIRRVNILRIGFGMRWKKRLGSKKKTNKNLNK